MMPLRDHIFVKPIDRIKSSFLEVVLSEEPSRGEIIACGPEAKAVSPGDKIVFGSYENYLKFPRIDQNGETYLVLQEADVCWIEES